jgi:hypothetical protein
MGVLIKDKGPRRPSTWSPLTHLMMIATIQEVKKK